MTKIFGHNILLRRMPMKIHHSKLELFCISLHSHDWLSYNVDSTGTTGSSTSLESINLRRLCSSGVWRNLFGAGAPSGTGYWFVFLSFCLCTSVLCICSRFSYRHTPHNVSRLSGTQKWTRIRASPSCSFRSFSHHHHVDVLKTA